MLKWMAIAAQSMPMNNRKSDRLMVGWRLLACGLAVWLCTLSVLSGSALLHRALHHDQEQGADSCAVCLLLKGHVESPAPAPALLIAVSLLDWAPPIVSENGPVFTYCSTQSRAPPTSLPILSVVV
jgi:hypothetical protein